jgi:UTP--glucose-1-phosphate uridylyltransferase
VLTARAFAGGQPFAVLLPDEIIEPSVRLLDRMLEVRARYGGSVVALMRVPPAELRNYGCAAVQPTAGGDIVRIAGMVEKPAPGDAPSDLAVIGRFVLGPAVFAELDRAQPGYGGEIQLTDALDAMAQPTHDGGPVHGLVFEGQRYDTGSHVGHLKAMVEMACAHDDLGAPFRQWLTAFVGTTR